MLWLGQFQFFYSFPIRNLYKHQHDLQQINWGLKGPYLTAAIQVLNSIGALFLVYAFRYGKAIIISPLANAGAPVITIILSLLIYGVFPHPVILTGMCLAVTAIFLLAD